MQEEKQALLDRPAAEYRRATARGLGLALLALAALLALDIALLLAVTPENGALLRAVNIVTTTLGGWAAVSFLILWYLPRRRKVWLAAGDDLIRTTVHGRVVGSDLHERSCGMPCQRVQLVCDDGPRTIYVMEGTFAPLLQAGPNTWLRITLAANIAVAWEVEP